MGKVYIGVMAVRGHKLWGGWWRERVLVEGYHWASNSCSRIHFRMRRSRREIWT